MAESSTPAVRRPAPAILLLLAVALGAVVVYLLWPAAGKPASPSNAAREQRRPAPASAAMQSGSATPLNVKLEALKQPPPAPEEAGRNPFRFYVKPPPPPPPVSTTRPVAPPPPPPPQPGQPGYTPPPIPLKFIGTLEVRGRRVGIFVNTDGRGMPLYAGEGEIVLGQYRVVKIGVESATLEYLDGRGKQIIPMRG